jgi:thiol-disulfide isomerase/thioredoxin
MAMKKVKPHLIFVLTAISLLVQILPVSSEEALYLCQNPSQPQSNSNLQQIRPKLWVYDFYAQWCPNCKALSPYVEQAMAKYNGLIELVPLDIDQSESKIYVERSGIKIVPTIVVVDANGIPLQELVGLEEGQQLDKVIAGLLQ